MLYQKSNVSFLLLSSFVLIYVACTSSHPVNVLEVAVPPPPLSIFHRESIVLECRPYLYQAIESNYRVTNLMKLAVCLHQMNLIDDAAALYVYINQIHPDFSFVLTNLALLRLIAGDPHQAKALLGRYFQHVGGIYGNDVSFIQDRDTLTYGPACTAASMYKSNCVYALNMYASVHMQLANNSYSLQLYKRALDLADEDDSTLSNIYANMGDLLNNLGDEDGAADCFVKAFWKSLQEGKINPGLLIRRAILVPSISSSIEQAVNIQRRFHQRILDLVKVIEYGGVNMDDDRSDLFRVSNNISSPGMIDVIPSLQSTLDDWAMNIQIPHFFLHYYGFNDRVSNELVSAMYRKVSVSSLQKSYMDSSPHHSSAERRIKRIVFVSCLLGGDEPHGLLILPVLKRLPKDLFETVALGVGMQRPESDFLNAVDIYYHVGNDSAKASTLLVTLQPDCVVFMEHVNNGIMQFLLFQRYARIQILLMGAPVTCGVLMSIDYFISGDRLEHPFRTQLSGDQHSREPYTEQVVLLDGQAISFPKRQYFPDQDDLLAAGEARGALTALGEKTNLTAENLLISMNSSVPVYMCFQSLFKIHPLFDTILTKILIADRRGIVILQSARDALRTKRVMDRLVRSVSTDVCVDDSFPCTEAKNVLSRIFFIPRVKSDKLLQLFQKATVGLHPFPFDGSKTASDVINASVPLVTFPQEYLRGRMAQNFFATMALHEIDEDVAACCIASDTSDYISKVIRLGQDQEYRAKVVHAISQRNSRIFDDSQVAFEWSRFLCRALEIKITAVDLAQRMNYSPERWQQDDVLNDQMIRIQKHFKRSLVAEYFLRRRVLV